MFFRYKFDVKLSRRAQEVAGMPLINYNLNTSINPSISTKEPLKRTISACATSGMYNLFLITHPTRKLGALSQREGNCISFKLFYTKLKIFE